MRRCRINALNFKYKQMKNREPWNFCETPKEKCTMNYCDENGCQNRKRNYVEGNDLIADVIVPKGTLVCNYCLEKVSSLPDDFGCQRCIDNYK